MAIASYQGERFKLDDIGECIVLYSKLAPGVSVAFSDWDAVADVAELLLQGLPPEMRCNLLTESFSARELELAFDELAGNLA